MRRAAFSLIEIVISLAILAGGLIGAMRVFPVGLRASQRAERSSRAALLGQRALESLKLISWEALEPGETVDTMDDFTITTRLRAIQPEPLTDPGRLKEAIVRVEWEQDQRQRDMSLVTYLRHDPS